MRAHGTQARYKRGPDEHGNPGKACRCTPCREAGNAYMRHRHRMISYGRWQPHVDAAGTRRRIEALVWNGWSLTRLAARLGWARPVLQHKMGSVHVAAASAEKVRALYDELWDQAPPEETKDEKRAASMARRYAREHGFAAPLAWDEDGIDDPDARPVAGWERGEGRQWGTLADEARELFGFGLGQREVAERLGVSVSTLTTTLARVRKQAQQRGEADDRAA